MDKKNKKQIEKIAWFILISIIILSIESMIYLRVVENIPTEGSVLGIRYHQQYFAWGLCGITLIIIWQLLKIKEK